MTTTTAPTTIRAHAGRVGRALVAAAIAYLLATASAATVRVDVEIDSDEASSSDRFVWWASAREDWSVSRRAHLAHGTRAHVPADANIARLRVDVAADARRVQARRVSLAGAGVDASFDGAALSAAVRVAAGLRADPARAAEQSGLAWIVEGPAPHFVVDLPPGAWSATTRAWFAPARLVGAFAVGAVFVLLELLIGLALARRRLRPLDRLAAALSDEGVLVVDRRVAGVALALAACAAVYVALDLNQSSVHIWETQFGRTPTAQPFELGAPKHVRSDEYNVATPWALSQVKTGMALDAPALGGPRGALLASVPVLHATAIAQPKFWGFLVFDEATGFSWWWAYKTFTPLLAFFWLFAVLCRGGAAIAFIGALWIQASSFTQWWFSSNLPELLTAFAATCIGALYAMHATRRRFVVGGAALIAWGAVNLVLHAYPPFILPLAWLGVAVVAGRMLEPGALARARVDARFRALALAGAALAAAALIGAWVVDAAPALRALNETLYPGKRVAESGTLAVDRFLAGLFEHWRFDERRLPLPPTNASEAAGFVVLAPFAALVVRLRASARRAHAQASALLLYCVVVGAWVLAPLPGFLEAPLQALGWAWTPSYRALLGLGVGSIFSCVVVAARMRDASTGDVRRGHVARAVVVALAAVLVWRAGAHLAARDAAFFTPTTIAVGVAAATLTVAGVAFGRAAVLAAGVLLASIGPLSANPLSTGLDALLRKPILAAAVAASSPTDRWMVMGNFILAQGMKAHGLDVVGASWMTPDRRTIAAFDPAGRYENVWNRYAHVVFIPTPTNPEPVPKLIQTDLYEVWLDVCGPAPAAMGVTRVAYARFVPTQAELRCLTPLTAPSDAGVRLYRLNAPAR